MAFKDSDFIQLSGLQHFAFCRRQWALIHIEGLWAENFRTVEGNLMHERAHDETIRETRRDRISVHGLRIRSVELGVCGQCDVVEFLRDKQGVPLDGHEGLWKPFPVEYKRGEPKSMDEDRLQLCAQAMCLEEMLCCDILSGALFYGQIRRRETVSFSEELRSQVRNYLSEMHNLIRSGYTPKVRPTKACNACSLKEMCMPKLMKYGSASDYLASAIGEKT